MTEQEQRHTIAVLVDNEPGVLARVIGLFSGRGYNIDSLTVAEVDREQHLSRINIVTSGTAQVIEQIKALLDKLVPVHKVADLTVEGPHIERELALVKVAGEREKLVQALRIADFMHARLVDSAIGSFVFEITGSSEKEYSGMQCFDSGHHRAIHPDGCGLLLLRDSLTSGLLSKQAASIY
jgi:acetolactate synthase-1/3 small subunit